MVLKGFSEYGRRSRLWPVRDTLSGSQRLGYWQILVCRIGQVEGDYLNDIELQTTILAGLTSKDVDHSEG
jgi:hypothetical protein